MASLKGLCAAAILQLAYAQNPDYDQGVALLQKGRPVEAIAFLVRASQARPRDAQTWKALGVAHAAQSHYDLAEPAFRRACDLNPKIEDACYYHGRALYALDRFEPSLQVLNRAVGADPASWKIHLGIAQALEALGKAADAEKEYHTALSLCRGKDPQPGIAYAQFLLRQGRFSEAHGPLEEVLKRFPQSPEANTHLGRALLEQGRVGDAIRLLERAIAIAPASAQAHLLLAKAYVRSGRAVEAQQHFEAAARYEQASQDR